MGDVLDRSRRDRQQLRTVSKCHVPIVGRPTGCRISQGCEKLADGQSGKAKESCSRLRSHLAAVRY
jgi:hypothetical protein